MNTHLDILGPKRQSFLPKLASLTNQGFYLAGGTALALQYGHRDSIDFDFFKQGDIDPDKLRRELAGAFADMPIETLQLERNTLTLLIDGVQVSCFGYQYELLEKLVPAGDLQLASTLDIGCMKLSAVVSRATTKDYADLYYIIREHGLRNLLAAAAAKFPSINLQLVKKSLVYFEDVVEEPLIWKDGFEKSKDDLEKFFQKQVKSVA